MKQLDEIVQTLIINGSLTEQPGLFYGKTGIAVFFFHYARLTGNSLFQDYAMDLIEVLQKQITSTSSIRYDMGITGIGVGFDYFLQNGFIETEDNDFFEAYDARLYRAVLYEPELDLSLEGGLIGMGRYFINRLRGFGNKDGKLHSAMMHIVHEIARKIKKKMVPENEQPDVFRFMHDLVSLPEYAEKYAYSLQLCKEWDCIKRPDIQKIFPYLNNLLRLNVIQKYFKIDLTEEIRQEWTKWKEADIITTTNMGLMNGWTAEGLLYLTCFHNIGNSWLNLL